jgi:hypothetical protein
MELSNFLNGVVSKFKDSRVSRNVLELVQNIIEHKSIQLWSISDSKAEFDRSRRLLDGSLKSVLDAEKISGALRERSVAALGDKARLIVLHDPCDIRKKHSELLENIGKVRDLDGNIINGYSTFNTVGVDVKGKTVYPVDITAYSNRDEHYVNVEELEKFEKGKLQKSDSQANRERAKRIEQFVEEGSHINLPRLAYAQLRRVSRAFKAKNPDIILRHVLDRQFDGVGYFELIDQELEDEFVIRLKVSRNSNEVDVDEEADKTVAVKLKDVSMASSQTFVIDKLKVKKKVYQDAKCSIEWGTLTLKGKEYAVVRVTLTDRQGKAIYKNPMLLITNVTVKTTAQAREVYSNYLMRSKIEAVFKFLKDVLGWEEFRVRDYKSIESIIVLAYYVGGYFYEIGSDLTKSATIALIAQLGGGKGKVSRYYFVQGIKKLLVHASVNRFVAEQEISDETFGDMLAFVT